MRGHRDPPDAASSTDLSGLEGTLVYQRAEFVVRSAAGTVDGIHHVAGSQRFGSVRPSLEDTEDVLQSKLRILGVG